MNRAQLFFWINSLMFCAFLISAGIGLPLTYAPPPGLQGDLWKPIHSVSGILIFAGVATHLVLHGKWIAATAKRFPKKVGWRTRINFCVDFLLGGVFLLICISGLNQWLASIGCGTFFQMDASFWERMHRGTGTAMVAYIIIHLVLHAEWIKGAFRKPFKRYSDRTPSEVLL
jgi:hypothetical protein